MTRWATDPSPVALATQHDKQHQFGPPMRNPLGWDLVVADVDTDQLGTSTGEIERPAGPVATAIRKARLGIAHTGLNRAIANEGSLGPLAEIPLFTAGIEHAVFVDDQPGIVVVEHVMATKVMANVVEASDSSEIDDFLVRVGFPAHAVIVRPSGAGGPIAKGLVTREDVARAVDDVVVRRAQARVEVDLRAHLNPTRQIALTEVAERLAHRLGRLCPACNAPGWGLVELERKLPCEWCWRPTAEVAAEVTGCASAACGHRKRKATALDAASAGWCERCNP